MDFDSSRPGSPAGGPLQVVTPDRVNQQRDSPAHGSSARDSTVHEKINQFNNMSVFMQSKNLERKTADAALKRAMLGREEAEAEVHRYRDEAKALRKAVDEGKERERRVMERLETVMENYGRAKETHAHTQALWEKEIRRARKENFKSQSTTVKLQEELKSCRSKVKSVQDALDSEKERSHVREQEAFTARYQIVGVQQELEQALERIKVIEQERDAYKTAAQNEEVARIAAEGRIPLPKNEDPADEFASPKKITKKRASGVRVAKDSRVSLSAVEILSSEASEMEIEDLRFQVQAERSRADRAEEMVDFLQAECQMHCCPCSKNKSRASLTPQRHIEEHHESVIIHEPPVEHMHIDVEEAQSEPEEQLTHTPQGAPRSLPKLEEPDVELLLPRSKKEPRRSTIFCPKEGIFRTVSEQEAEALQAHLQEMEETQPEEYDDMLVEEVEDVEIDEAEDDDAEPERQARFYARTPSVEPPAFAILAKDRTSLMSLLNAPSNEAHSAPLPSLPSIPTMPDEHHHDEEVEIEESNTPADDEAQHNNVDPIKRPHTSFASYSVTTTTTTVPVRDETEQLASSSSFAEKLRTPSSGSNASFDLNNPALTPTMTREQALAKIRERRGRARSVEKKATTPGSGAGLRSATGGTTPALKKTSADRVDRRTASGLTRKPSKGR